MSTEAGSKPLHLLPAFMIYQAHTGFLMERHPTKFCGSVYNHLENSSRKFADIAT